MINLTVTGNTEIRVEQAARAADMTPGQWLHVAIAAALEFQPVKPGKALSEWRACQDPSCPDAWAEHAQHEREAIVS